jgi:hypothetical protein
MKTFTELMGEILLERELDRPMREAAGRSFDKFKKNIMGVLRKSVNDCAKNFHETSDFRPWGGIGRASATSYLVSSIQNNQPSSHKLRLYFADKYAILTYSVVDESQIVLPSNISMSTYKQNVHKSNMPLLLKIELLGSSGNFKGSYFSGKTSQGNPLVQLAGMSTLRHEGGDTFGDALIEFIDGKKAGKSAQALVRPLNKWLDKFETELSHFRDTYVHEFIHLFDDFRYKSKTSHPGNILRGIESSHDKTDLYKKDYYISDAEWNAFFQGAASSVENAVTSFLIAATNEQAAIKAYRFNKNFNTLTHSVKCKEVGDTVIQDLWRKIDDNLTEPWIWEHLKNMGIDSLGQGNIPTFCMAFVSWNAYSTSKYFLEDPAKRKKFLLRIVSFTQDIRNIIEEYRVRMSQGKIPTVQEFNRAKAKFKREGDPTKKHDPYSHLYSGLMIGKKPFDPTVVVKEW